MLNETRAGKIGRRWSLRNPRNDRQEPLSAAERTISPNADLPALVAAIVDQAKADLDAGYDGPYGDVGTANERYWRAQAYLWFFHGEPTGFERFTAWLGVNSRGRYPDHPLFDDAAELRRRRCDLVRLGLPLDLFNRRIAELPTPPDATAQMEFGRAGSLQCENGEYEHFTATPSDGGEHVPVHHPLQETECGG